ISERVDLFLYDLKIIDDRKHREYTGVSNKLIFDNLKMLVKKKKSVIIRIPLISGINDDQPNIKATINFLHSLNSLKEVNLLPYHKGGTEKFKKLGKQHLQPEFRPSSETKMKEIKRIFESYGFSVKIGG
ncbi:MAG: glycyl-radical enzyme activating protein, partial [Candidatus Aminicenantales bacterium]